MASTANGDKKRKKEKKNKNLQELPENNEFEGITKNKKKQRLQPLPTVVAAVREVEDRVMEKHGKKQNKKKDKKKERRERNRQDGCRPESAGDIVQKEKRNSRITDPRFSSAHFDPRFQRMPKRESKVVIDSRFTRMFSDKKFSTSSAPLDKRGKARKEKGANPLLHYYLHQEEEGEEGTEMKEEETDEPKEGSPELRRKASSSESEMEVSEEEEGEDFAASTSDESTSTSEEEDHDDDEVIILLPFICFNASIYQISLIFHFSNFLISGRWLY